MKKIISIQVILLFTASFLITTSCSDDNDDNDGNSDIAENPSEILVDSDKNALLFMLEEEKLARDTYMYLHAEWSINQFGNIKNSEQTHMDAIESLLIQYNIDYNILPYGVFEDETLQLYYDQFIAAGSISETNALQIGATIEDLDIVDLQIYIDATTNTDLMTVFNRLQCGSRNHLRSFVNGIENNGHTYTPQYLSSEEYNLIIQSNQEQCN